VFHGGAGNQTNGTITTGTESGFVFDQTKINDITSTFRDYFYVYSGGEAVDFTYSSYQEGSGHVNLFYMLDGQPFNISMSKDYKYLYPNIIDYTAFKAQVATAKTEMAAAQEEQSQELQKTETPEVLLFVMSFCPYGNVAEDAMAPVITALGSSSMEFEPIYIVSGDGSGNWDSLHGSQELNQDVREKIVYNLYGLDKWNEYVAKVNERCTYSNADECWKAPAEEVGINTTDVELHFNNSTEVNELLVREATLSAQYGVSGSPTLIINGKTMSIARTSESYKDAICSAYTAAPGNCNVTLSEAQAAASGSCG
ncbi:hypothetical protein H0O02_02625, partial [Candidatus Micrarchaeota archaeon]|nr:hypothetical protein [Candidatus Micrarchaeota archaeon]